MIRWYKHRLPGFADGGIRFAGPDVIEVARVEDADVIVVANCLFEPFRQPAAWAALWADPVLTANPRRVVLFDCSDDDAIPPVPGCHYFRCGLTRDQQRRYPTAECWPWPVPDLGWIRKDGPTDAEARRYDVTFQGWGSPRPETPRAVASVRRVFAPDRVHLAVHQDFHGHRHAKAGVHDPLAAYDAALGDETIRREAEYRHGLRHAWLSLAPQSIVGVLRYRALEALSCGRIPVLIGHDYVLPFADRIPWADITVQIHSNDADRTGEILRDWLAATLEPERRFREEVARSVWSTWLDKAKHPTLMATRVRERLEAAA